MYCNEYKKRDICVSICTKVEKYISQDRVSLREKPLPDKQLFPLFENYLRELHAPYFNRIQLSLDQILSSLTPAQRTLVELYFIEGMTPSLIAKRLKLNKKAVAVRLARVRKKLKKITTNS